MTVSTDGHALERRDTPIGGDLRVHHSFDLQRLVDALVSVVAEPLASPFAAECIVVPSRAMGEWLGLRAALARHSRIAEDR